MDRAFVQMLRTYAVYNHSFQFECRRTNLLRAYVDAKQQKVKVLTNECNSHTIYVRFKAPAVAVAVVVHTKIWLGYMQTLHDIHVYVGFVYPIFMSVEMIPIQIWWSWEK